LDYLVNLFAQHTDGLGGAYTKPNLIAAYPDHGHDDIVSNGYTFTQAATEDEHWNLLLEKIEQAGLDNLSRRL